MSTVRKQYSKEFKQETLRLIVDQGVCVAQVSRDMGINANVLYRWKQEALERVMHFVHLEYVS
jgi:transposase